MIDCLVQISGRGHRVRMPFLVLVFFAMICGACSDYPLEWDEKTANTSFQTQKNALSNECAALERELERELGNMNKERRFFKILREQIEAEKVAEYHSILLEMEDIREIQRAAREACPVEEARKSDSAWTKLDARLRKVESEFDTLDRTLRTIVSHVEMEGN